MMSQSQYSLTWEAHVRNVCDGLSSLQQNGEFVDMTLAADGHMVKVHQVVLALASPYFKDLITSAQCPHPVIFLSKVTYNTLSAILEYIYTGEVLVSLEHLSDLVEAAKELHIKGLKDMKIHPTLAETTKEMPIVPPTEDVLNEEDYCLYQVAQETGEADGNLKDVQTREEDNMIQFPEEVGDYDSEQLTEQATQPEIQDEELMDPMQDVEERPDAFDVTLDHEVLGENDTHCIEDEDMLEADDDVPVQSGNGKLDPTGSALQYTVSNQGSLQMILNRFVYYLKHTNRDTSRQWRCVDYLNHVAKCPAHVFTKDDIVVHRIAAHTHPFHDDKILKKLRSGSVFSAFTEAKKEGDLKKKKTPDLNNR